MALVPPKLGIATALGRLGLVRYLLIPRPGPYFSLGKTAFFAMGALVAFASPIADRPLARIVLAYVCYEWLVSHGKYFINDFAGRNYDQHLPRGRANQFPSTPGSRAGVSLYVGLRLALGSVGFAAATDSLSAIALPIASIGLQVMYEVAKRLAMRLATMGCFAAVSLNYGVRALAGAAAVGGSGVLLSPYGGLALGWGICIGGIFLLGYWTKQAAVYVAGSDRLLYCTEVLLRAKPMLLFFRGREAWARVAAGAAFAVWSFASGVLCWIVIDPGFGAARLCSLTAYIVLGFAVPVTFAVMGASLRVLVGVAASVATVVAIIGHDPIGLAFALLLTGASVYGWLVPCLTRATSVEEIECAGVREA